MNKFVFGVLAIALGVATAITEEDIGKLKTALKPIIEKCGADYGLTFDAVVAAAQSKTTDSFDPCFHACFFKSIGVLNEEGLFTPEVAIAKKGQFIPSSSESADHEADFAKCVSVNDQAVSDGAKGCERAKLLHTCVKEKLPFLPL